MAKKKKRKLVPIKALESLYELINEPVNARGLDDIESGFAGDKLHSVNDVLKQARRELRRILGWKAYSRVFRKT